LPPTLWCCLFIPFHEEIMLMASYPLRLSAAMLAALVLKICGTGIVYSGTSLNLPDLNIAITDACSGINQLDAFLLIAYVTVKMMHSKANWQALHFTFIIPSVIVANALRIVLTVLLFKIFGEVILDKFWHVTLGYAQILIALLIFIAVGKLFSVKPEEKLEDEA
jgi:exosortase/archaeosortase family protein